jgi:glycosyltransferase involved in cell wall biosynthesis
MIPDVVYFHRKRRICSYSLEFHFEDVRARLERRIKARVEVAPFLSKGIVRRIAILLHAFFRRGRINHVTGDISFLPLALIGSSVVLTIPDCGEYRNREGITGWIFKALWIRWPVKLSEVVTTISEASKREICAICRCDPSKVIVVPVAVSIDFKRHEKPFNAACPRLLQVGTSANKNLEGVIMAISGLPCVLAIIGKLTREQTAMLEKHGIRYENFVGLETAEVAEQYRLADIVVFASHFEGFGMPIIEAQATGRPVIAGNNSSMPEVAGDGAILVDSQDPKTIRHAIMQLIEDEVSRAKLVLAGLANAARFNNDQIAESYFRIYDSMSQSD